MKNIFIIVGELFLLIALWFGLERSGYIDEVFGQKSDVDQKFAVIDTTPRAELTIPYAEDLILNVVQQQGSRTRNNTTSSASRTSSSTGKVSQTTTTTQKTTNTLNIDTVPTSSITSSSSSFLNNLFRQRTGSAKNGSTPPSDTLEVIGTIPLPDPGTTPSDPDPQESSPSNPTPTDPDDDIFNSDGSLNINSGPATVSLTNLQSGATVDIDGSIDLQGQTISLPSNITLLYDGGEIVNGTLNFGSGGIIDGHLMNSSLTVTGSLQLQQDVFVFHPERWSSTIVQGNVSKATALNNNKNFEALMAKVSSLGGSTFVVGTFDAYFEVNTVTSTTSNQNFYPQKEAVNIPSNFTLQMSDDTILRVYPTEGNSSASLLAFDATSNSAIYGGVLYGDRDIRTWSPGSNVEEGALLLTIRSGKNILIDGVTFTMSSKSALTMNSYGFSFQPNYDPTTNITIRNSTFDKNRGLALSVTDGHGVIIERNDFTDTAQPTTNSDGGVVGHAIDIEPIRNRDAVTGEILWYQVAEDIIIRDNYERNSRLGSITIYAGENVSIENNDVERTISWSYASNSQVVNNTITAPPNAIKPGIIAGGDGATTFNNLISGNTVTGYPVAISADYQDIVISNNIIEDFTTGIQFKDAEDMQIFGNSFTSTRSGSKGIQGHLARIDGVEIYNNNFEVAGNGIYFVQLNKEVGDENNIVHIHDNTFNPTGSFTISNSNGILLEDNTIQNTIQITGGSNVTIDSNVINSSTHGITLSNENTDIDITNNDINYPQSGSNQCVRDQSTTGSTVVQSGNVCN